MPVPAALLVRGSSQRSQGAKGLDTKILVVKVEHLLSSSKSSRTGTIGISGHKPSRRARRTIALTMANKAQIPNNSVEVMY